VCAIDSALVPAAPSSCHAVLHKYMELCSANVSSAPQQRTVCEAHKSNTFNTMHCCYHTTHTVHCNSEHERYITEQVYKCPVVVTNYPKEIKAFYMKLDADGRTVSAMDILVPKIGEIIGGSQREEDFTVLMQRAAAMGLEPASVSWYADLRRYGTMKHAGFGLGFERLILFITGVENIRDVIPFPRYPGHCEY
jgi:aspartyl/asparaginyl-tRNA synthetase